MWAFVQLEGKKQLQDKSLIFWMLILPIIFIVGAMEIFGSRISDKTAVVNQIIPGYIVFFSIFIIITMTISFVKDCERGFVARLASTPLSTKEYLVGKWIPFVVLVFGQILFLAILGMFIYDMKIGNPVYFALISFVLSLMVTSWGIAIAVFSKTETTGIVLTQIIAFSGAILGGLWIPFQFLPKAVQMIGKFTPHYWSHQALINTLSDQLDGEKILYALLVMLSYMIVSFFLSLIGYRRFLRISRS